VTAELDDVFRAFAAAAQGDHARAARLVEAMSSGDRARLAAATVAIRDALVGAEPRPKVDLPQHAHGEAYRVMTYASDDGTERELIWNSRDGVTPFVIRLRSGKEAKHVDWDGDRYAPRHKPAPGDRIFVDLTSERAREIAAAQAQRAWDDPGDFGEHTRVTYDSTEQLTEVLTHEYARPGAPDLVTVREDGTW
jgi:hypothetical protein